MSFVKNKKLDTESEAGDADNDELNNYDETVVVEQGTRKHLGAGEFLVLSSFAVGADSLRRHYWRWRIF